VPRRLPAPSAEGTPRPRRATGLRPAVPDEVTVERPRNPEHGDYATNLAFALAKAAGKPPRVLGEAIAKHLRLDSHFAIEVLNYLAEKGVIDKVSQLIKLTPKSRLSVEEIGFMYIAH